MTTVVFDSNTKTLWADTQSTESNDGMFVGVNFNNLKLFRTSTFIAGGSGNYYAAVAMMAHLIGWQLDAKIYEIPNLEGPSTWQDSRFIAATDDTVAMFECSLIVPWNPFAKCYAKWKCIDVWEYAANKNTHRTPLEYICIGSGSTAFGESMEETGNVIESFHTAAELDEHTGGRLISTSLRGEELLVDHGPLGFKPRRLTL